MTGTVLSQLFATQFSGYQAGSYVASSVTITGGTVDGTTIGASHPSPGTFSAIFSNASLAAGDSSIAVPTTAFLNSNVVRADKTQALTSAQKSVGRYNSSSAAWYALASQNIAINSRHQVSQFYYNNAVAALNGYLTDSFFVGNTGVTLSGQRVAAPFSSRPDIQNGITITVSTADAAPAAGDFQNIHQRIEGTRIEHLNWGTSSAQNLFVAMMVRTSVAGTYYVWIRNGTTSNRSIVQKITIAANTDTQIKLIFQGDTTGTWATDSSYAMAVGICLMCGSTASLPTTSANVWQAGNYIACTDQTNWAATSGATFTMSDLVVLPVVQGVTDPSTVVPSEMLPFFRRSIAEELMLCSRYFASGFQTGIVPGSTGVGSAIANSDITATNWLVIGSVFFPVEMRTSPTVTWYNPQTGATASAWNGNGSASVPVTTTAQTTRAATCMVQNSSVPGGQVVYAQYTADARL